LKAWLMFTATLFVIAQSILKGLGHNEWGVEVGNASRITVFVFRVFVYVFCLGQLAVYHAKVSAEAYKNNETFKWYCLTIPEYLRAFQEWVSLLQAVTLVSMLAICPKLYCMGHWWEDYYGYGVLSDHCPQAHTDPNGKVGVGQITTAYGILSTITMFIFFMRMIDLAVLDNTLSAYVIMAGQVMIEVALFLGALCFCIAAWSCSVMALFEYQDNFLNLPVAAKTYVTTAFWTFNPTQYETWFGSNCIYIMLIGFQIAIHIFLLNLLIAQICSAHKAVYEDIIGFARMGRITSIYQTMPYVATQSWEKWIVSLNLEERLEFNVGDIGLAGGIQVKEPANANITIVDSIRRFGGSTSPAVPWPQEEEEGDEQQGFDRLEKMMQRIAKKVGGDGKRSGKGGSSGIGSSGLSGGGSDAASREKAEGSEGSE